MIPRYTRQEMARIWSPERRFRIWLDVELAACEAMVPLGEVPAEEFAQLVVAPVVRVEVALADELSGTGRGSGGFGSTGRQ